MKKSGDTITIDPYFTPTYYLTIQESRNEKSVQYFFIHSSNVFNAGEENLDDVAKFIANYDNKREASIKTKAKLVNFYRINIKGKPVQMLMDGNHYIDEIMNEMFEFGGDMSFDEFLKDFDLYRLVGSDKDIDYVKTAIKLSNDSSDYSDRYKNVYGHRPIVDNDNDNIL